MEKSSNIFLLALFLAAIFPHSHACGSKSEAPSKPTVKTTQAPPKIIPTLDEVGTVKEECGIKFLVSKIEESWENSSNICKQLNKKLLSLDSEQKENCVSKIFAGKKSTFTFWTSGTDEGHDGNFKWRSTGQFLTPSLDQFWADGQPDNMGGDQHCLLAEFEPKRPAMLSDEDCTENHTFICEN